MRTDLLQHEIQVESLGGEVVDVEVSATKKTNIDKLLEMLGLQAEILDLKANPTRAAEGTVIEAKLDRGRGPVATVLVQRGTLHVGDIVVAGAEWGRVRALDVGYRRSDRQCRTIDTGRSAWLLGHAGCRRPPGGRRQRSPRARSVPITVRGRSARRWPRARPACAARSSR